MKIISFMNALTVIAAPWDEVRPVTGGAFPNTIQLVRAKYQFQVAGQSPTSQQAGLLTPNFQGGQLGVGDGFVPINLFEFQPGGIVISSSKTEFTEQFTDDVFPFLQEQLGFRAPSKDRRRVYTTVIVADFGPDISKLFGVWGSLGEKLNKLVEGGPEIIPFGVHFAAINPADNQMIADRRFVFERRALTPPNEHWIYSQAPLKTEEHLGFLQEIAAVING